MKFLKKNIFIFSILFFPIYLFAFEWPVDVSSSDSKIEVYFGENRGKDFSKGFVFSSSEDIKASEDGTVLVHLNPKTNYYENFTSTLGNALIMIHKDEMISVYSGFEEINPECLTKPVEKNSILGYLNKQNIDEESNLVEKKSDKPKKIEFQIIDTRNKVVINPFLLLSNLEKTTSVFPGKIFVVNKKGTEYCLDERKSMASGVYSIYREYNPGRMPLKMTVFLNGEETSLVNFDTILFKNNRICVAGKDFFPIEKIYPKNNRQFLGEIELSRGKNSITVVITDNLGVERRINHIVEAW